MTGEIGWRTWQLGEEGSLVSSGPTARNWRRATERAICPTHKPAGVGQGTCGLYLCTGHYSLVHAFGMVLLQQVAVLGQVEALTPTYPDPYADKSEEVRQTERLRILRLFVVPSVFDRATRLPLPPQRLSAEAVGISPFGQALLAERAPWLGGVDDVVPELVSYRQTERHNCGRIWAGVNVAP